MRPKAHLKYSVLAAVLLYPFFQFRVIWFLFVSTLLDVDHYLDFVIKKRDFSIRRAIAYNEELYQQVKQHNYLGINILHTIEFLIIITLILHKWPIFKIIILGILFHLILDLMALWRYRCPFARAFSIIEYFIRASKRKASENV